MKLNTKVIKELIEAGCEYDVAVRLVKDGVRIQRIEEKRSKRDRSHRGPRVEE